MKKIKRLQDIKQEKMRLRIKQLELEKQMQQDWKLLKSGAKSSAQNKEKKEASEKNEDQSLWSAALNYGTAYISQKLAATAGEATEARVKQSMDSFVDKIRNIFDKKKRRRDKQGS